MNTRKKYAVLFSLLALALSLAAVPAEAIEKTRTGYSYSHFIGGRIGGWSMTGDAVETEGFDRPVERSSGALYGEFFYGHRFNPYLVGEVSIGVFDQGDITYDDGTLFTAATVYPMILSVKFYPFGSKGMGPFFPYLRAGGGAAYGSRDAINDIYYTYDYGPEDTEFKFTYAVGGGFDWPVASQIGLLLDFKYIPIEFGEPLAGFKDYSGWELSFGVGYIFQNK